MLMLLVYPSWGNNKRKEDASRILFLFIDGVLSFSYDLSNLHDGHHCFLHGAYGDELVAAMEVDASCKDVRAGKAFE